MPNCRLAPPFNKTEFTSIDSHLIDFYSHRTEKWLLPPSPLLLLAWLQRLDALLPPMPHASEPSAPQRWARFHPCPRSLHSLHPWPLACHLSRYVVLTTSRLPEAMGKLSRSRVLLMTTYNETTIRDRCDNEMQNDASSGASCLCG